MLNDKMEELQDRIRHLENLANPLTMLVGELPNPLIVKPLPIVKENDGVNL